MASLKETVHQVVAGYAGKGLNGVSYLTQSEDGNVLIVGDFARVQGKHVSGISVVVRLIENSVIVEQDQNDKLVLDALLQAGVPREQIVLAYAGEAVPETA